MNNGLQLAQKYKKYKISEILGQPHIVKYYTKRFKQRTIPYVNLFIGSSGTGKSSLQRSIALSLVCDDLDEDGNPCLTCDACQDIIQGRFAMSVKEYNGFNIDIDSVKSIIEEANSYDMSGKPKILILDEFQGISSEKASRTLLKVLEDETIDTYWLIGAMDKSKIKIESASRGVTFNMEELPYEALAEIIEDVLEKEQIEYPTEFFSPSLSIEESGIHMLIESSNGSARQVMAFLDTIVGAEVWSAKEIAKLFGIISQSDLLSAVQAMLDGDIQKLGASHIAWNDTGLKDLRYILKEVVKSLSGYVYSYSEQWMAKKIERLNFKGKDTNSIEKILKNLYNLDSYPVRTKDLIEFYLLASCREMSNSPLKRTRIIEGSNGAIPLSK